MLDSADRDARGYSAHLLSCFPELGGRIAPVLAARLAVEPDVGVGALLCLSSGLVGEPGDTALVHQITLRRGQRGRVTRWTVLMGLARLIEEPDAELLRDLCDCLFEAAEPVAGWPFHQGDLGGAAAAALDALPVGVAPRLAGLLAERMRTGGGDATPFFRALPLLLSAVFPDGPLPAGTSVAELTAGQHIAARVVVESGLIEHPFIRRALVECRLPGDEETLRFWLRLAG